MITNQILYQDLQKSIIIIDYFRSDIYKYIHIINRVILLINKLRTGLILNKGSNELEPLLYPIV